MKSKKKSSKGKPAKGAKRRGRGGASRKAARRAFLMAAGAAAAAEYVGGLASYTPSAEIPVIGGEKLDGADLLGLAGGGALAMGKLNNPDYATIAGVFAGRLAGKVAG